MRSLFVSLFLLLSFMSAAWGQSLPSSPGGVSYGSNGGVLRPAPLSQVGDGWRAWAANDSDLGGARVSDRHTVGLAGGRQAANASIYANRAISWAGVAAALRWAGTAGLAVSVGSAIYDAWQAARVRPDGKGGWVDPVTYASASTFYCYAGYNDGCDLPFPSGRYASELDAVRATFPPTAYSGRLTRCGEPAVTSTGSGYRDWLWTYCTAGGVVDTALTYRIARRDAAVCVSPSGSVSAYPLGGKCPDAPAVSLSPAEVASRLESARASVRPGEVLREAVGHGYVIPESEVSPLPATGPASVGAPARNVTRTNPDGTTSVQSVPGTVYNLTYNASNTYNFTVTESDLAPDGSLTQTTSDPVPSCGLPGSPSCRVSVDEAGTPSWEDKPASALDELKSAEAAKRDELLSKVPEPDLGWFGAPPIAECAPFEFPDNMGSLNPCGVVNQTREVMAYLWALAAAWLSFGMIRKAATGGS